MHVLVTNIGPQEPQEIVIIKLDEGANAEDFIMAMGPDAPPGPPPGQIVAGTDAFMHGMVAQFDIPG